MSVVSESASAPLETLRLTVAAESDTAGRDENQDVALALVIGAHFLHEGGDDFLLLVADGMGGHPAGDVASRIAADTLRNAFSEFPTADAGLALKQAYRKANDAIFQAGELEPTYAGMGTTLTVALLRGKYATVANVGDSRAYLLRGEGLTQVTQDHTLVAEEVAKGRVAPDAARRDPRRNVLTHAVGTNSRLDSKLPSIFELTLLPGDRLLLCSDGLYDVLDDVDFRRALRDSEPDTSARALVALAKERGTRDNATAVIAAAIPTRISTAAVPQLAEARTGGVPGIAIAGAVAVLLVLLLVLAVYLLGATR